MTYKTLTIEIDQHIAHIQLNRPEKLNAMNLDFWEEFPRSIKQLDQRGDIRAIVLSSTGKHFSAGMDLAVFANSDLLGNDTAHPAQRAERFRHAVGYFQDAFTTLEKARIPVLIAVQGGCIGGALDLICAGDCRYATQDSYFTIKETELGMTADVGTLQRLPKLIPQGLCRELAYTGRNMSADEALRCGLINQVFEDQDSMLEHVMGIARDIAKLSPLAVTGCKEMINYSRDHTVDESLNYMRIWQTGMFSLDEMNITFTAQQEGSSPIYPDLKAL